MSSPLCEPSDPKRYGSRSQTGRVMVRYADIVDKTALLCPKYTPVKLCLPDDEADTIVFDLICDTRRRGHPAMLWANSYHVTQRPEPLIADHVHDASGRLAPLHQTKAVNSPSAQLPFRPTDSQPAIPAMLALPYSEPPILVLFSLSGLIILLNVVRRLIDEVCSAGLIADLPLEVSGNAHSAISSQKTLRSSFSS